MVSERATNLLVRFLRKISVFFFAGMENPTSMMRLPLLNENNYTYWKVRVKAFIKSINEKAWLSILKKWSLPTVATNDMTVTLKSEKTWTKAENILANNNFKTLNAIFSTVDVTQLKLISACESARDAWIILQMLIRELHQSRFQS